MSPAPPSSEVYAFGPFLLDVRERRLSRAGEAIPLRAKLFDTLVALVRSEGRLVERDELIEAVWGDTIVEEGNLSHNVSVLRKALHEETQTTWIETVPKLGYRFAGPVERRADAEPAPDDSLDDELERARRAARSGAWHEAHELLHAAAERGELGSLDLLRYAEAAQFSGRFDAVVPALERALEAAEREGDGLHIARAALELARTLLERRRPALVARHLRRAERALPAARDPGSPAARAACTLAWLRNRLSWSREAWPQALAEAELALEQSRALGVRETEALALMDRAHVLLVLERYEEAARGLDEAGAVLSSSELAPGATGVVVCGLIFGWRTCGDWARAAEWTEASIRWCDTEGIAYFPGLCRVHRGELIRLRGALAEAEADLERGCAELVAADSSTAGIGLRELGLVRLRRGDLAGAEAAFRRAMEFGLDPQPGLALLRAARGERLEAFRELARFAEEIQSHGSPLERQERVFVLPVLVELALAVDEIGTARSACAELEQLADATGSRAHRAAFDGAAGRLALREGRVADAIAALRRSWRGWSELDAPFEAAAAREPLARALMLEGDRERARLELEAAASAYERLGAPLDRRRASAALDALQPGAATRARRVLVYAEIVDAEKLREAIGADAWAQLVAWLEETLRACWRENGGEGLPRADGGFAARFIELADAAGCATRVQHSLAEHRRRHGFAPAMRGGMLDGALLSETDAEASSLGLARALARRAGAGELAVALAVEGGSRRLEPRELRTAVREELLVDGRRIALARFAGIALVNAGLTLAD